MKNLVDLEKKINSELGTKITNTQIKHNQIYVEINKDDLIDVTLFIKTNKDTKFRQLIDITIPNLMFLLQHHFLRNDHPSETTLNRLFLAPEKFVDSRTRNAVHLTSPLYAILFLPLCVFFVKFHALFPWRMDAHLI